MQAGGGGGGTKFGLWEEIWWMQSYIFYSYDFMPWNNRGCQTFVHDHDHYCYKNSQRQYFDDLGA